MYKADSEIEKEFENFSIEKVDFQSSSSGYIYITWCEAGEHVSGGQEYLESETCDGFTIYDSGKIAFNSWYPEKVYHALCEYINAKK